MNLRKHAVAVYTGLALVMLAAALLVISAHVAVADPMGAVASGSVSGLVLLGALFMVLAGVASDVRVREAAR